MADTTPAAVLDPFCTASHACTPGSDPVRCSRRVDHTRPLLAHRCPKCLMRWTGRWTEQGSSRG